MVFSKQLLDGIRRGRITCSIRFWTRPHVKVGGRYPLGDGRIVVDAITPIEISDVTYALARESGFSSVQALLDIARHGSGENIYLIRFHYLRPGAWDVGPGANAAGRTRDEQLGTGFVCLWSLAAAAHPQERRAGGIASDRHRPAQRAPRSRPLGVRPSNA